MAFIIGINVFYNYIYGWVYEYKKTFTNVSNIDIENQGIAEILSSNDNIYILRRKNVTSKIIFLITLSSIIAHIIAYKYNILFGILSYILIPIVVDMAINLAIYLWKAVFSSRHFEEEMIEIPTDSVQIKLGE